MGLGKGNWGTSHLSQIDTLYIDGPHKPVAFEFTFVYFKFLYLISNYVDVPQHNAILY